MKTMTFVCALSVMVAAGAASAQVLVRPDSATAASEFSGSYDIGNAIDGSGLPANFTVLDTHATYVQNNHWTTQSNALNAGNARASFFFSAPQELYSFNMWNHRSDGVAADGNYAVTRFDLILRDGTGAVLFSLLDQTAVGGVFIAQNYAFAAVSGVRQVDFIIEANRGSQYTGVGEVAFNGVVPAPGAAVALVGAGVVMGRRRR